MLSIRSCLDLVFLKLKLLDILRCVIVSLLNKASQIKCNPSSPILVSEISKECNLLQLESTGEIK